MSEGFYKRLKVFANLTFSLSLVQLTFMILNFFNPKMGLLSTNYSKAVFIAFAVCAAVTALHVLTLLAEMKRREAARRRRARLEERER